MTSKPEYVVYEEAVPPRDFGILYKPVSRKEEDVENSIKAALKHLEDNPSVERTDINLYNFYKKWIGNELPGIDEISKGMVRRALQSFKLTIEQTRGQPMRAYLEQRFFPTPFSENKVRSFDPKFKVTTDPLLLEDRVINVRGTPVTDCLVINMVYDLNRPARDQILEYSSEAEIMVEQYCIFRDIEEEHVESDEPGA